MDKKLKALKVSEEIKEEDRELRDEILDDIDWIRAYQKGRPKTLS